MRVLIEHLAYPKGKQSQSPEETVVRMGALAEFLHQKPKPQDSRVSDCLSFIASESHEAFDFLYPFPPAIGGEWFVTRILEDLLMATSDKKFHGWDPALEEKFGLAKALVCSIHRLHTAEWLHKSINPKNVLFFKEDTPKGEINFDEPYLANFSNSRPDGNVWATDGPSPNHNYQRPEYLMADGPPPRYEEKYDSKAKEGPQPPSKLC